jgi:transcriptional regulator with XRE-family HTH domain
MTSRKKAMSQQERAFHKAFGARITRLREKTGLTQVEVAASLRIAQQTYSAYESGRHRFAISLLPALAEILMTDANELVGIRVKKTSSRRGSG